MQDADCERGQRVSVETNHGVMSSFGVVLEWFMWLEVCFVLSIL